MSTGMPEKAKKKLVSLAKFRRPHSHAMECLVFMPAIFESCSRNWQIFANLQLLPAGAREASLIPRFFRYRARAVSVLVFRVSVQF